MKPVKITEAYVKSLADPLVRHMSEPPFDPATVLAVAVRAALHEAWEMINLGEIGLRQAEERQASGNAPGSLGFVMQCHGQIYAGTKVIRAVADALRLLRPDEHNSTRGQRVYAARRALALDCTEAARRAGIDRSFLSRIERGERTLHPEIAGALAGVLDVTAAYLLTGAGG